MSIKHAMQLKALEDGRKEDRARLDKLENDVKLLLKSVTHMERTPVSESGLRVPPTERPVTLEKLELGKDSKGD